jgi:hypothetical protein
MGIETLAIGSLVASTASGVVGAVGASNSAEATAQSYQYKAQVAENNAKIAEQNAQAARESGTAQAQSNDMKTKAQVGTQLAAQAANGLDVNTGTNVAVRQSTTDLGHLDTLTILNNATKNAAGYTNQANNYRSEATLDTMSASNARTAGDYNVATSLLGSAGSVADKWMKYSSSGAL